MNKVGKAGDPIKHPNHYCFSKFEPKDVIREWELNFNLGSAVNYIARAGRKEDIVQDLKKAQEFIQFEIDAIEEKRAKQVPPANHPNCRCTHNPYTGADDFMDALVYGLDAILEDITQKEALSVKPIVAKVPDGVDVDEFIKQLIGKVEAEVGDTPHEEYKKKSKEFNEACLPVLEFLNKYYDPHSYAVITEGRAEIVRGDMGTPLPIRD